MFCTIRATPNFLQKGHVKKVKMAILPPGGNVAGGNLTFFTKVYYNNNLVVPYFHCIFNIILEEKIR